MRTKILLAAAMIACGLLTACSSTNISKFTKELANDHSALVDDIVTPWGQGHGLRVNPATNQDVKITKPDGTVIEIKSH